MSIHAKLKGNLTADPVRKTVRVGNEPRTLLEFRVFSDEYKQVGDELVQDDDHCVGVDVTVWQERLIERLHQHLRKGARVQVEGSLVLERFPDRETQEPRSALKMTADDVTLVLSRIESIAFSPSRAQREAQGAAVPA